MLGSNVERWRELVKASAGLDFGSAFAAAADWKHLDAAGLARTTLLSDADVRTTALKLTEAVAAYPSRGWAPPRHVENWEAWPPSEVTSESAAESASAFDTAPAAPIQPESPDRLEQDPRLRLVQLGIVLLVAGSVASTIAGIRLLILAGENLGAILGSIFGEVTALLAYPPVSRRSGGWSQRSRPDTGNLPGPIGSRPGQTDRRIVWAPVGVRSRLLGPAFPVP